MRTLFTAAAAVTLLIPAAGLAQDMRAYVVRLGSDTLSLEQVTRTATQVRGEYVTWTPRSSHRIYTLDLNPDGTVKHYDLVLHNLGPGPGPMDSHTTVDFYGRQRDRRGAARRQHRHDAHGRREGRGSAPQRRDGIARADRPAGEGVGRQGTTRCRSSRPANPTLRGIVTKAGKDTQTVIIETSAGKVGPYRFGLDSKGRLAWFTGVGSTFQAEAKAVPLRRPRRGDGVVHRASARPAVARATPCGRRSAAASSGSTTVGRPSGIVTCSAASCRGIRCGGRAPTPRRSSTPAPISTSAASRCRPARIRSWTLPSPTGWKLIVNKQTGQWGTEYHQDQDLRSGRPQGRVVATAAGDVHDRDRAAGPTRRRSR